MRTPLLFYMIGEHSDSNKYCRRRGLIPYKFQILKCELDGTMIESVIQYTKNGYVYDVLDSSQCYTMGDMVTLMRLPKLPYKRLLNLALNSVYLEERQGATGIILKDFPKEFEKTLVLMSNSESNKNTKRMVEYVYSLISDIPNEGNLDKIQDLCEILKLQSNNKSKYKQRNVF